MNECISESDYMCELILPDSVSLLVVKLWDLVSRKIETRRHNSLNRL